MKDKYSSVFIHHCRLLFSLTLHRTISSTILAAHFPTLLLALLPSPHTRSSPRSCLCSPASSSLPSSRRALIFTLWVSFPSLCLYLQTFISICLMDIVTQTSCWNLSTSISRIKYIILLLTIWFFSLLSFSDNTTSPTPHSLSSKP